MQIKVYTIGVKVPRWVKRAMVFGVIPALLLGAVAVVVAQPPETFSDNEVLSATKMNGNFSNLQTQINNLVPAGTVVAFAGAAAPAGWLLCDGSAVSRVTYAGLLGVIGITHGGGDGVATFNVPDYRGRFLRGVDGTAGRDPDAESRIGPQTGVPAVTGGPGNAGNRVGSVQSPATALPATSFAASSAGGHSHTFIGQNKCFNTQSGSGLTPCTYITADSSLVSGTSAAGGHGHEILGGDPETRPNNAYVNYIIKF